MVAKFPLTEPLPEVVVSTTAASAEIARSVRSGALRKIAPRLYSPNLVDAPETIVARNQWIVLGALFPGTVVGYRTALNTRPTPGGKVFLVGGYDRVVRLPGLTVRVLKGAGPLEGDMRFGEALHIASEARAILECLSVRRVGAESPALPRVEIEELLERRLAQRGEQALNTVRDLARRIAPAMGGERELRALDALIGSLLGTRKDSLHAASAVARAAGEPYDSARVERFSSLMAALREWGGVSWPDPDLAGRAFENLAFFDAYFSNFIEGTEFEVEEAAEIVFERKIPTARPADAHDVLGTYRLVANGQEMRRTALEWVDSPERFVEVLKARHAMILGERPDARPGMFKEVVNRAGETFFVAPELVRGTLRRGLEMFPALTEPFQRAAYMMFLVSEVHPFDDGNGRVARAMMNAELIAGGERRILIPTAFRADYVGALRRLSRAGDAEALIRVLDFAQRFTAAIDFSDLDTAHAVLRRARAFDTGDDARLRMPPPD
jgi:hypothetical protein